ncbi:MFS transporter [Streptomyces sp. NPDC021749]|uniref:MFS transporter n=1 Tax=Streptomyces sp. NPDC021749 TaxID=3154905 RepID=UPI0034102F14
MPRPREARHSKELPWPLMTVACTTQFVVVLDVSVVHVALPSVRSDLGFTSEGLQWVVTAYMLAFGGSLLLGGRLADFFGSRRTLLCGMILFATASLVAGLAWEPGVLIAARAVQGIGAAVLSPVSLTLLTREFHDKRMRARALAAWGGVAAAAGAAGVFVGGLVTQYLNWRWTMLINVPIALIVLVLARFAVASRDRDTTWRKPDAVGALTVTAALIACVYGVEPGRAAVLGAGAALLALFALWEAKGARDPLLPFAVLRDRSVSLANASMFLTAAATFSMWYFLSLHLQNQRGFSPLATGLAFLPQYLAIVAGAQLAARLLPACGARRLLVVGALLQSAGFAWLSFAGPHSTFLTHILLPGLLVTVALGLASTPLTMAATGGLPASRAGLASGLVNTSRHLGGAMGVAALAAVAGQRPGGVDRIFRTDALLLAAVASLALLLPPPAPPAAGPAGPAPREGRTARKDSSEPA